MVTLDDFGLNRSANEEIRKWTETKKVDFISLLANSPFTSEAIQIVKSEKKRMYRLGLHFNLIEGKALCNKEEIASLVDRKGNFYPLPLFMLRLFIGLVKKEDVMKELQEQYAIFTQNEIECVHLNSHQNIHVFHFIYSCIEDFAKNNNIKYIRQISTVKNRLKKFPIKYFLFLFLYLLSSLLFSSYTHTQTRFYETTFHPGTEYDGN